MPTPTSLGGGGPGQIATILVFRTRTRPFRRILPAASIVTIVPRTTIPRAGSKLCSQAGVNEKMAAIAQTNKGLLPKPDCAQKRRLTAPISVLLQRAPE